MTTSRLSRFALAAALIPLLVGGLAACSTPGPVDDGAGPDTESPAYTSFEDWQLDFADCMRGEGIDMPDPSGNGSTMQAPEGDQAAFSAAADVCFAELGTPPGPDGQPQESDEARLEHQLEVAACFRENGVDVADPAEGEAMAFPMDAPREVIELCTDGGPE